MSIPKITVGITITRDENDLAVTIPDSNFEPYQTLTAEPGRHIVAVRAIPDLDLELDPTGIGSLGDDISEDVAVPQNLKALLSGVRQFLKLHNENIPGLVTVVGKRPTLGKYLVVRYLVLEFIGAPAGLVIELQLLLKGGNLLCFNVVREDSRMQDRVIGPREDMAC